MKLLKCLYQGMVVDVAESLDVDSPMETGVLFGIIKEGGEAKYLLVHLNNDGTYGRQVLFPINSVWMWPNKELRVPNIDPDSNIVNLF